MNDQIPDRTVVIALLVTIMLVFAMIFSIRPNNQDIAPTIEWKESSAGNIEAVKL